MTNFLVDGVLLFGFSIGVFRALDEREMSWMLGPLLLATFALGVLGAGIFATDPGGGYPPGMSSEPTPHGTLHDLVSLVVFTVLPVACLVFARRFAVWEERSWAIYSAVTGILLAALFATLLVGFNASNGISDIAGLIQRVWIVLGWGWLLLVARHLLRTRATIAPR